MLENPSFWVAIAFVCVVVLSYKKGSVLLLAALDARTAKIRHELDEARRLREEAEAVLAEYRKKQSEYMKEAEAILNAARKDADALRAHAEKELSQALEARTRHAVERIAQEEANAIADVRNHVVDIALAAAKNLIAEQVSTLSQDDLIKLALADIERKVH